MHFTQSMENSKLNMDAGKDRIKFEKDLIEVFDIDIMREIDEEHESNINPHN